MLRLVAVQAKTSVEDYLSADSFKAKIFSLCQEALSGYSGEAILAFPEVIGLPLLFAKDYKAMADSGLRLAFINLLKRDYKALFATAIKHKISLKSLYFYNALAAYKIYKESFAEAAKEFGAVIIAGTMFLPEIDDEITKGSHILGRGVYNYSYSFLPSSKTIARVAKVNLTRLEQKLLLNKASQSDNYPFRVKNHKIAVAICLDAFYDSIIARYDALGSTIVVQPSANFAAWKRPWPQDNSLSEGEAWLKYGLRQQIQQRENIRYGINPMLVTELFGMQVEGRSSIVANQKYLADISLEGYSGLLAISQSYDKEELVYFDIS